MAASTGLKVFVSHSSKDNELVSRLVHLLRGSLNLPTAAIRCTSLPGFRLPGGADTDGAIRAEIIDAVIVVGVLSESSLSSLYVGFELGARWGAKKPLLPVLAPGLSPDIVGRPLSALNVLRADQPSDLHQLVSQTGELLGIAPEPPAGYQPYVDAITSSSSGVDRRTHGSSPEREIYNSKDRDLAFDFQGRGAHRWKNVDGKDQAYGDAGKGSLTFEPGGVLEIRRSNLDGKFELALQVYEHSGKETTAIPRDPSITGLRRLRVSCEARATGGEHALQFVLRNESTGKWIANHLVNVAPGAWIPIKFELQVPASEECRFRIDDLNLTHAESGVQIRGIRLAERVS